MNINIQGVAGGKNVRLRSYGYVWIIDIKLYSSYCFIPYHIYDLIGTKRLLCRYR